LGMLPLNWRCWHQLSHLERLLLFLWLLLANCVS
jgi:hypothetical protein